MNVAVTGSKGVPSGMAGLRFRKMTADDKDAIAAFYRDMGAKSASFFNVDHGNEKRTMAFFAGEKEDHTFFVLEDEDTGRIAALAFLWTNDSLVPWFGIAVADGYQGRRLGSMMVERVFDYAQGLGLGGILLRTAVNNIPAQRLYEKKGFERLGVHPSGELLYIKRFIK